MASESDQQVSEENMREDNLGSDDALDTSGIETGADTLLEFLDGEGKNSVSSISEDLGVPEKTVKIWGKALQKEGYINISYSAVKGMVLKYSADRPYEELDLGEPEKKEEKGEEETSEKIEEESEEVSSSADVESEEVKTDELDVEADEVETHTKEAEGVHSTTHRVKEKNEDKDSRTGSKELDSSGRKEEKKETGKSGESGEDEEEQTETGKKTDKEKEGEKEDGRRELGQTPSKDKTDRENKKQEQKEEREGEEEGDNVVSDEEGKIEQANVTEKGKDIGKEELDEELENVEDELGESNGKKTRKKVRAKKAKVTELEDPEKDDKQEEGNGFELKEVNTSERSGVEPGEESSKTLKDHMREIYEDIGERNPDMDLPSEVGKESGKPSEEEEESDELDKAVEDLKRTGDKLRSPEFGRKHVYNELNGNLMVLKHEMASHSLDESDKLKVRGVMDKLEEDLENEVNPSKGFFSKVKGLLN